MIVSKISGVVGHEVKTSTLGAILTKYSIGNLKILILEYFVLAEQNSSYFHESTLQSLFTASELMLFLPLQGWEGISWMGS